MAIGMLANPEVRLQANPIYDRIEPAFSHTEELPGFLLDLPGFGSCLRVTSFSSEPYQEVKETLVAQQTLKPTVDIHTALAQTSLSSVRRESSSPPPPRDSTSPPPLGKGGIDHVFRKSKAQEAYEKHLNQLKAEQERAGFPR